MRFIRFIWRTLNNLRRLLQLLIMFFIFAIIVAALVLYARERVPMEVTSVGVICVLLVFFHFFPVPDGAGANPPLLGISPRPPVPGPRPSPGY